MNALHSHSYLLKQKYFPRFYLFLIAWTVGIVQSSGYITMKHQASNLFNNY